MKKKLFIWLAALLLLVCCAVAEEPDVTGVWYLVEYRSEDTVFYPEIMGMDMTLTLFSDYTGVIKDAKGSTTFTWTGDETNVILATKKGESFSLTLSEGQLTGDYTDIDLIFQREIIQPGDLESLYSPIFNWDYFTSQNPGLQFPNDTSHMVALHYFLNFGTSTGMIGSPEFDIAYYRSTYPELKNEFGSLLNKYYEHYLSEGKAAGYAGSYESSFSAVYDYDYYLAHNSDIKKALGTDRAKILNHFITKGMAEGRRGNESFDIRIYMLNYADLRNAFGNNLKSYYTHYIQSGSKEHRVANRLLPTPDPREKEYVDVYNYEYYVTRYPEVAEKLGESRKRVLDHFLSSGMKEGRRGCEGFDVATYRQNYPDLQKIYGDDLQKYYTHYIKSGKAEKREAVIDRREAQYAAVYNYDYYLSHNKDIASKLNDSRATVLNHFLNSGMKEGRIASEEFNPKLYRRNYPELNALYGDDYTKYYEHYLTTGQKEKRNATTLIAHPDPREPEYAAVYDYDFYISHYADVRKYAGNDRTAAIEHFLKSGMKEGRMANETFNVLAYRNNNSDLNKAYGNDLAKYYTHYMKYGKAEKREAITDKREAQYAAVYNFEYYVTHNKDVQEKVGINRVMAMDHFLNSGMKEGRRACEEFNVRDYMSMYSDLRKSFGNDLEKYYSHYMKTGKKEGRRGVKAEEKE